MQCRISVPKSRRCRREANLNSLDLCWEKEQTIVCQCCPVDLYFTKLHMDPFLFLMIFKYCGLWVCQRTYENYSNPQLTLLLFGSSFCPGLFTRKLRDGVGVDPEPEGEYHRQRHCLFFRPLPSLFTFISGNPRD